MGVVVKKGLSGEAAAAKAGARRKDSYTAVDGDARVVGVKRVGVSEAGVHVTSAADHHRTYGRTASALPYGAECWVYTAKLADVAVDPARFQPAEDAEEAEEALRRLYPDVVHGVIVRVVPHRQEYSRESTHYGFDVFADKPLLDVTAATRTGDGVEPAERLEDLIKRHGPLLVAFDTDKDNTFNGHAPDTVVLGASGSSNYRVARYAPTKAEAGRKAADTAVARENAAAALRRAAADMRKSVDDCCHAVLAAVAAACRPAEVGSVLNDNLRDSYSAESYEQPRRRRGYYHYQAPHKPAHLCVARLRAACDLHDKLVGKASHRRVDAWAQLVEAYKSLPAELRVADGDYNRRDWGCAYDGGDWFLAEMKARVPRPRPPKAAEAGDAAPA